METGMRTFLKAITWQVSGLVVMVALAYVATGNLSVAGGLALVSSATGFVTYFLHERLWQRVRW
ncbi:MAG: DUF2061 domain-containing protein, partial [Pseudomonadota bacterium]